MSHVRARLYRRGGGGDLPWLAAGLSVTLSDFACLSFTLIFRDVFFVTELDEISTSVDVFL